MENAEAALSAASLSDRNIPAAGSATTGSFSGGIRVRIEGLSGENEPCLGVQRVLLWRVGTTSYELSRESGSSEPLWAFLPCSTQFVFGGASGAANSPRKPKQSNGWWLVSLPGTPSSPHRRKQDKKK